MAKIYLLIHSHDNSSTMTSLCKKIFFLNGDLQEEIYMEQPSNFISHEESSGYVIFENLYMDSSTRSCHNILFLAFLRNQIITN